MWVKFTVVKISVWHSFYFLAIIAPPEFFHGSLSDEATENLRLVVSSGVLHDGPLYYFFVKT